MDEILATIQKNKLRTALTAFGVFWGIFMIVLMLGMGNGLQNGVMKQFGNMVSNSMWMWGGRTSLPYNGMKPGRQVQLKVSDVDFIRANIDGIKHIIPESQLGGFRGSVVVRRKQNSQSFGVNGAFPESQNVSMPIIAEGRFLNHGDIENERKVVAIGERVKQLLFADVPSPIGHNLEINGVYFTVVGWFKSSKSDDRANEDLNKCYVPFTTFQKAFNFGDNVGWIAVIGEDGADIDQIGNDIKRKLASKKQYSPDDLQAIGGWSAKKELDKLNGLFTGIELFVWIVGFFTLLAGIVGIGNIMLIVVKERTKEIGIRKAIGATPFSILSMILFETVLLTVFSGYLGITLGVLLVENIENLLLFAGKILETDISLTMFANPGIDISVAITALSILVVFGAIAGFVPALNAVRINPIEALRDE